MENFINSLEITLQEAKNAQQKIQEQTVNTNEIQVRSRKNETDPSSLNICPNSSGNVGSQINKKRKLSNNEVKLKYIRPRVPFTLSRMKSDNKVNATLPRRPPKLFENDSDTDEEQTDEEKYWKIASGDYFAACHPSMKRLLILGIMEMFNFQRALCFTKSDESTHHLYLVLNEMSNITAQELTSNLSFAQCKVIFEQFGSTGRNILLCSEDFAKYITVKNLDCIFYYDTPIDRYADRVNIEALIIITLLERQEVLNFKRIAYSSGIDNIVDMKEWCYFSCSTIREYELALSVSEAAEDTK